MTKEFIEWLADMLRVYAPADMDYPDSFAETIAEEMVEAGWKPIRVAE